MLDTSTEVARNSAMQQLEEQGYVLIRPVSLPTDTAELERYLTIAMVLLGRTISKSAAYVTLEGCGDDKPLAIHSESVYATAGITPYFALGCVVPAETGGETSVYNGKQACAIIERDHPEIACTEIEYFSRAYPRENAVHPLCNRSSLRYRGQVPENYIRHQGRGIQDADLYKTVDTILERSLLVRHRWQRGDILLINNKITLHGRMPYKGRRVLVRVRFDDPLNISVRY